MESCVRGYHIATHVHQELWEAVIVCLPVKNFRAFNFRHLGNWRKFFNGENFPIYVYMQFSLLFPVRQDRNSFFMLNVYKNYSTLCQTIKSLCITIFIIVHTITVRTQQSC